MTERHRTIGDPAPEVAARWQERHADVQEAYAAFAAPVADDLERAGFPVARLRDLRRRGVGGPAALPVLLHWLPQVTFAALKVDVIYALGSPWARPEACRPLLAEHAFLHDEPGEAAKRVRVAICSSLERIADESVLEEVIGLATDHSIGAERGMAVVALGNMRQARERVTPLLVELLGDEHLELFALLGLSKLGARETIREFALRSRLRNPMMRRLAVRTTAAWTSKVKPPKP